MKHRRPRGGALRAGLRDWVRALRELVYPPREDAEKGPQR